MKSETASRNPFGVMDVPHPDDAEVKAFAAGASLVGAADDDNASSWTSSGGDETIEGPWLGRWNGGADPTISGDAADKWKQGRAEVRVVNDRVYILFDWDNGARRGLIDAARVSDTRLVGKYINLTNPAVMRPWIGLIVDRRRIDGRWTQGRLDFRR
jgi:hypothetical protein